MSIKSNFCLLLILYCCIDREFFGTYVNSSKEKINSKEITINGRTAHVNVFGLTFIYKIQNYVNGANIYWIVQELGGDIPSKIDIKRGGLRFLCSNKKLQNDLRSNYIAQECPLKAGTNYELWCVLDTDINGLLGTSQKYTFHTGQQDAPSVWFKNLDKKKKTIW